MSRVLLAAVPLAPLVAAALSLALAKRRPVWAGGLLLAGNAIALAALVVAGDEHLQLQAVWLHAAGASVNVGLVLDPLSRYGALIVAGVALPVNIYALAYMAREPARGLFFAGMSFFLGAMLTLVLASSLLLLFAAWELVGVASFALIGFNHRDPAARSAAGQALLLTRAGDVMMLLGWLLAWRITGSDDISRVLAHAASGAFAQDASTLVAFLLLGGALGKSAQLPFSAWLPAAMAGPTPVSALLHSATMVAAGAYLILRLYPLFAGAPVALSALLWIGGASALFAALLATAQADLKRVLAWSTVSQLGEMFFALGLAAPFSAAFHLATHAAYKAALFLAAGAVEQAVGTRALDRLGGLAARMPVTAATFIVSAAALAGVPPFSGFWSEDAILGAAARHSTAAASLMLALVALAGVYVGRAATATFARRSGAPRVGAQPPARAMKAGMAVLALGAIGLGWVLSGRIDRLLPFASPTAAAEWWRIGAAASGLGGLAFGAWHVRAHGTAAAITSPVLRLERLLLAVTRAPARLGLSLAASVQALERALDKGARRAVLAAHLLASRSSLLESIFDGAGRAIARRAMGLADVAQRVERAAFRQPIDGLAARVGLAGASVRGVETGRLYLYTSGIVAWVLAAFIAAILIL